MSNQETSRSLALLNYSALWLETEILTRTQLLQQIEDFNSGEDDHTEHYRYKTFKHFIEQQASIDNSKLNHLLQILKMDQDQSMAGSAAIGLLKQEYLTQEQFLMVVIHLRSCGNYYEKYIDKAEALRNDSPSNVN